MIVNNDLIDNFHQLLTDDYETENFLLHMIKGNVFNELLQLLPEMEETGGMIQEGG